MDPLFSDFLQYLGQPLNQLAIKSNKKEHKGLAGQLIEESLGAHTGNSKYPDLFEYGIEIKTIPVNFEGIPHEHTYINKISLPYREVNFEDSFVWMKLRKILWIPLIGKKTTPMLEKIIGHPILWEPTQDEKNILTKDWAELSNLIRQQEFDKINSQLGEYLHIRPKASNSQDKISIKIDGFLKKIVPIGFYLRKELTRKIIQQHYLY